MNSRRRKQKKSIKRYSIDELRTLYSDFIAEAVLDYHEFDILNENAILQIYDTFIKESLQFSQKKLLIITGKGALVRPTIQRRLRGDKRIKESRVAGRYNGQSGAFEVELN